MPNKLHRAIDYTEFRGLLDELNVLFYSASDEKDILTLALQIGAMETIHNGYISEDHVPAPDAVEWNKDHEYLRFFWEDFITEREELFNMLYEAIKTGDDYYFGLDYIHNIYEYVMDNYLTPFYITMEE